jgi:peroxiredoxin
MRRTLILMALVAFTLVSTYAAAATPAVPRPAAEFAIQMPNGKQALLSQYRGKVVALGFYFTTCPHCQVTCAFMERLSGQLGAKGFQPIGVAFNENANMLVPDFTRSMRLTFPFGPASRESVYDFLHEDPNARGTVPQMVLVDRKGVVRYQSPPAGDDIFFKEDTLRKRIEELLSEPAGKPAAKSAAKKKAN